MGNLCIDARRKASKYNLQAWILAGCGNCGLSHAEVECVLDDVESGG